MLFRLMYACGLRFSEATGLRVEDVDFEGGALRVIGKGDRERRLYMKPYLLGELHSYARDYERVGYLFTGHGGERRMSGENVEHLLKWLVAIVVSPGAFLLGTSPGATMAVGRDFRIGSVDRFVVETRVMSAPGLSLRT